MWVRCLEARSIQVACSIQVARSIHIARGIHVAHSNRTQGEKRNTLKCGCTSEDGRGEGIY